MLTPWKPALSSGVGAATVEEIGFMDETDELVISIAYRLIKRADGPLDDPATWEDIAQRRGYIIYPFHSPGERACRGEIIHRCGRAPVIVYNTAFPLSEQARFVLHELVHGILIEEDADASMSPYIIHHYDDDPSDSRHDIARRVERLVLG